MSRRQTTTTGTATRPPKSERDANPYANLDIFSLLIQAQPQLDIGSDGLMARCGVFKTGVEKFVAANREEIVKRREVYTTTVAREREAAKEFEREVEGCKQQQIQLIKRTSGAFYTCLRRPTIVSQVWRKKRESGRKQTTRTTTTTGRSRRRGPKLPSETRRYTC
jgi:hypothetical protein